MRPMYGCPEHFRESLAHGYFSPNFGWAFLPIDSVNVRRLQNLKFVALPIVCMVHGP